MQLRNRCTRGAANTSPTAAAAAAFSSTDAAEDGAPNGEGTVEVAVLGGSGFFGRELVRALAGTGVHTVRSVDICEPEDPIEGVEYMQCDVTDRDALLVVLEGCDLVYHTSAVIDLSPFPSRPVGGRPKIEAVNIGGTENVIECCTTLGVGRLVYTSTGDVIFNGQPKRGVDESELYAPLPSIYNHYISSKACAEQLVLAADSDTLRTVALRPGKEDEDEEEGGGGGGGIWGRVT
jgi:nucleoside-diphosphate-sugar epimerase